MNRTEITSRVYRVTEKLFAVDESALNANTDLRDDLGGDSMTLVELAVNLEEEFDAEMGALAGAEVRTIGDVIDLIVANYPA